MSKVLGRMNDNTLHMEWPTDFDKNGMPRATRVPLGLTAKMFVSAGLPTWMRRQHPAGMNYAWYRGLYYLIGAEEFCSRPL